MNYAIETFALSKQFPAPTGWLGWLSRKEPPRPAVDSVDLAVRQGELFGLLGPNGAGKTTLIKLLTTLIAPSSGRAQIMGYDLRQDAAIKACAGLATSDERSFYWRLSGRQNLEFFAALQNLPQAEIRYRVDEALAAVHMAESAQQRFQTYSTGMRQRLTIARALLHRPQLLFLDEPTKGLDPTAARQLQQLIRQLVETQGLTVFLTTHILEEAEQICDRVAVMHRGRMRGCGNLSELRNELGLGERFTLRVRGLANGLAAGLSAGAAASAKATGAGETSIEVTALPGETSLTGVIDQIRATGGEFLSIERTTASLETIFASLTNDATPTLSAPARALDAGGETSIHPAPAARRSAGLLRTFWAFLKKDFYEEASYRISFLLQFSSIFFSLAVFYYLSLLVGETAEPLLGGVQGGYFAYALIGLAFASYFNVGLNSFPESLRRAQTTGTLEAMLTTPTPLSTIILASAQWSFLVTTLRVVLFLLIGLPLAKINLQGANFPAAALVLLLTIVVFSSLGILAASFIMVLKRGDPVTWAFGILSTIFGGVYFPVSLLPGWIQTAARFLPITYALNAMRQAMLSGASFSALLEDLAALAGFALLLLPLSLLAFRFAVQRARVEGSLTHY